MSDSPSRNPRPARWVLFGLLAAAAALGWWHLTRSSAAPGADVFTPPIHPLALLSDDSHCDVLVVGGTPSGVAAALAAARRGARVVLVEERPHLGGDIVYAMLNMFDVPMRPGTKSPAVYGIFGEFFEQLGVAYSIDKARRLLEDAVSAEPHIRTYMRTTIARIDKQENRVTGVVLRGLPGGPLNHNGPEQKLVTANVVVDATNDASFAARAGSGYFLGRQRINPDKHMQSAGLLFAVSHVDWNAVRRYVHGERALMVDDKPKPKPAAKSGVPTAAQPVPGGAVGNPPAGLLPGEVHHHQHRVYLRLGGMSGNYAWERGDVVRAYQPHGPDIMALSINFGRQTDGTVVLNTLNILGVNGLSAYSVEQGRREGIAELPYFLAYLRKKMPGFEHAQVAKVAPELYIRETRHIQGPYELTVDDVRGGRKFYDRVALVSYPLDLHPYAKNQLNPFALRRYNYTMPFRCLLSARLDGVIIASRSISASYSAAGSCRVIPITMAEGEAAGAAAWLCGKMGITPHEMLKKPGAIARLQDSLRSNGSDVGDVVPVAKQPTPLTESEIAFNHRLAAQATAEARPPTSPAAVPSAPSGTGAPSDAKLDKNVVRVETPQH